MSLDNDLATVQLVFRQANKRDPSFVDQTDLDALSRIQAHIERLQRVANAAQRCREIAAPHLAMTQAEKDGAVFFNLRMPPKAMEQFVEGIRETLDALRDLDDTVKHKR